MSEANKRLVERWQEAYNRGDLDDLHNILGDGWTSNAWMHTAPQSVQAAKEVHQAMLAAFPDLQYSTHQLVAEGDWVVQRWVARGTMRGEVAGLSPTGAGVECGGVNMFRIADGRIVEHWGYADDIGLLHQLGADLDPRWLPMQHR